LFSGKPDYRPLPTTWVVALEDIEGSWKVRFFEGPHQALILLKSNLPRQLPPLTWSYNQDMLNAQALIAGLDIDLAPLLPH